MIKFFQYFRMYSANCHTVDILVMLSKRSHTIHSRQRNTEHFTLAHTVNIVNIACHRELALEKPQYELCHVCGHTKLCGMLIAFVATKSLHGSRTFITSLYEPVRNCFFQICNLFYNLLHGASTITSCLC